MRTVRLVFSTLVLAFMICMAAYGQEQAWKKYTFANVRALAEQGGAIWAGSSSGLAKIDRRTGEMTILTELNSGLPDNSVTALAADREGNLWIGTYQSGLVKFDGGTWTAYDKTNSGLPDNHVLSLAVDGSGNLWVGTDRGGFFRYDGESWKLFQEEYVLAAAVDRNGNLWTGNPGGASRYDGSAWKMYDTSNSGLPYSQVNAIAVEPGGTVWFGTGWSDRGGLAQFDGNDWAFYKSGNSGLPNNIVHCLALDPEGGMWIGTENGLARFDRAEWTVYTHSNSALPANFITALFIDADNDKWIGTTSGLAVFNAAGTFTGVDLAGSVPAAFSLSQNYPNPFNASTTLSFTLPADSRISLKIFNILGEEIAVLVEGILPSGEHRVTWNAAGCASGVYFSRLVTGDAVITRELLYMK
jgi:ligand-binding sensor domain-containing protein